MVQDKIQPLKIVVSYGPRDKFFARALAQARFHVENNVINTRYRTVRISTDLIPKMLVEQAANERKVQRLRRLAEHYANLSALAHQLAEELSDNQDSLEDILKDIERMSWKIVNDDK